MTFGVIGSSFFWKCVKLLAEQLWQIWRCYAPPFFSLSAKNLRGERIIAPPPAVRGLTRSLHAGQPKTHVSGGTQNVFVVSPHSVGSATRHTPPHITRHPHIIPITEVTWVTHQVTSHPVTQRTDARQGQRELETKNAPVQYECQPGGLCTAITNSNVEQGRDNQRKKKIQELIGK